MFFLRSVKEPSRCPYKYISLVLTSSITVTHIDPQISLSIYMTMALVCFDKLRAQLEQHKCQMEYHQTEAEQNKCLMQQHAAQMEAHRHKSLLPSKPTIFRTKQWLLVSLYVFSALFQSFFFFKICFWKA